MEQQIENEKRENEESEQLVKSAAAVLAQIDVPELSEVKQKILVRQEEIKSKSR